MSEKTPDVGLCTECRKVGPLHYVEVAGLGFCETCDAKERRRFEREFTCIHCGRPVRLESHVGGRPGVCKECHDSGEAWCAHCRRWLPKAQFPFACCCADCVTEEKPE